MIRRLLGVAFVATVACGCQATTPARLTTLDGNYRVARGTTYRWSFDEPRSTPGTGAPMTPDHPRTFLSVLGQWNVEREPGAPSEPNVYRQGGRFAVGESPRVVVSELVFGDLSLKVQCRPESGTRDEACGVMLRVEDQDNYLVVRANGVDGTVKLVRVLNGHEDEIASAPANVQTGTWHSLSVKTRAEKVVVWWDEMRVINADDEQLPAGKIGLWTRADSVTAFDDLEVRAD